jgi:two-component system sensor histidine kinase/response regulator
MRHAHSLKGAAGSLGLNSLRSAAATLEAALRENRPADQTMPLLDALTQVHRELSDLLHQKLGIATQVTCSFDAAQVQALVAQLLPLLENDDMRTSDLVRREHDLLSSALGPEFVEFERHVDNFDFPAAFEHLQSVLNAHPEFRPE